MGGDEAIKEAGLALLFAARFELRAFQTVLEPSISRRGWARPRLMCPTTTHWGSVLSGSSVGILGGAAGPWSQ